jgi:hypothetical protein
VQVIGSRATISNNNISGGRGALLSRGVCISGNFAQPTLLGNTIVGSMATFPGPTIGVECDGTGFSAVSPTLRSNVVLTHSYGDASGDVIGASLTQCGAILERNRFQTGSTLATVTLTSTGVRLMDNTAVQAVLQNNVIRGGNSPSSRGIHVVGSNPRIYNNTIVTGDLVSSPESGNYVVLLGIGGQPTLANNIFLGSGGANDYCVVELAANSDPGLSNNAFWGCPGKLYLDNDSGRTFDQICSGKPGSHNGIPALDCLNQLTTPAGTGNVEANPFLDATYSSPTASSPTSVTQGGMDLSGSFSDDLPGYARTVPWSMGAYEKD